MDESVKEAEAMIDEDTLAARLKVSKRTLQDMRLRREGVPFVKIGALVRYKVEDVERYIAERRVQTASRFVGPGHAGLTQYFERVERRTPVESPSAAPASPASAVESRDRGSQSR